MAFARRACDLLRCCFALSEDGDDVELVVDANVPPVDGSSMPSAGVVGDENPYRFELDAIAQMFNRRLDALKREQEQRLVEVAEASRRELEAFKQQHEEHLTILAQAQRRDFDNLNERVTAVDERCDKFDSRINTLREQQQYQEPIFPTYSDSYVPEDQEVMPQFDP